MILLNWLLALGALAFTVPLAIHLLFRNKFEIIDWGAMRFLESVVRVNRRRMQLKNLLLLLLRCAIPILLAFCLARPVITGWKTLPGDEPVSMVLALDTSYSLGARVDLSGRRIDRIVTAAEDIVSSLPRGSDVMLVTSADAANENGADDFRGDPQAMLTALQSLKLGGASLSLESLLSESLRKISTATTERRQVVLLTDDVASDFSQAQLSSLDAIGQRCAALTPAPTMAWIDAWPADDNPSNNRRITRLEPAQSASVPGQSVVWSVEARVDGDEPTTTSLDIRVDGTSLESKTLSFRGGIATATFETEFKDAGRHAIEVALPADDDFASDDRLRSDYVVLPSIDVWLVDGNPTGKALQGDTDFLAIALSPFSLAGEKSVDLFSTSRVALRQLDSRKDETPKIVVLADVGALRSEVAAWLSDFVENQGGSLVIFAGPATDGELWDKQLTTADTKPMLPMKWADVKTTNDSELGSKIDESRLTYPPLAAFDREAKGTLASVEVASYRVMLPRDKDATPKVVMRLENGAPLIAVADVGKGRVMQVATTANARWTSLPRRLAFVPLMQRLFMHLATGESRLTTPSAGEPILLDLAAAAEKPVKLKKGEAPTPPPIHWTVTAPNGVTSQLDAVDGRLRFTNTNVAGVYRFDGDRAIYASINVPNADLKRTPAESSVRADAEKRIGATRYDSVSAFQSDDSTKRFGRGVWRYLLLALLAAMIFEPFLQQRGARVTS